MKSSFKNALNALVLLCFMFLAWATSKEQVPFASIAMEVTINPDSTAFILKNLEDFDLSDGNASFSRRIINPRTDTLLASLFFQDSINLKAKETIVLPLNVFLGRNSKGQLDTFARGNKLESFRYDAAFKKDNNNVRGLFGFDF